MLDLKFLLAFLSFSICVYSRHVVWEFQTSLHLFSATFVMAHALAPIIDAEATTISPSHPQRIHAKPQLMTADAKASTKKRRKKKPQRMQRKQKQKSAEIPARCSIFKCSSEVQPHQDSSPSGKAKKMPCNPSKGKEKEVKRGIREGLPHAEGGTLAFFNSRLKCPNYLEPLHGLFLTI